jgi:acetyl-CoA synthetase
MLSPDCCSLPVLNLTLPLLCKVARVLKEMGIKKGTTVAIYMPTIPETIIDFLAVVRVGAMHSVIFAGFSASALRERIIIPRTSRASGQN